MRNSDLLFMGLTMTNGVLCVNKSEDIGHKRYRLKSDRQPFGGINFLVLPFYKRHHGKIRIQTDIITIYVYTLTIIWCNASSPFVLTSRGLVYQ